VSRREKKPVDDGPGWLATYGDLVTLLLAFFVMLFAVSSVEAQKFEAFLTGLGHFDNAAAAPGIFDPTGTAAQYAVNPTIGNGNGNGNGDGTGVEAELERIEEQIIEAAEAAGVLGSLSIRPDARGVAAAIATDQVLFASGSAELTSAGLGLLDGIAGVLARLPYNVTVEGHSDSVPLDRGGYSNWNLSTDRAVAVVHHFIRQGMGSPRFAAAGFADQRPVDRADTAEARTKNRRVEIVIHARPVTTAAPAPAASGPDAGAARTAPVPQINVFDPSTLRTTSSNTAVPTTP
jgi:chemotaxis protein MotB